MTWWPSKHPDRVLGTRVTALALALAIQVLCLVQLDRTLPPDRVLAAHLACLALITGSVVAFARRKSVPGEPFAVGPLLIAASQGLAVGQATVALCISALFAHSLYGGRREALVRGATVPLVPLVLVVTHNVMSSEPSVALPPLLVPVILLALVALVLRTHYEALDEAERARRREALLADTSRALLGQTSLAAVRAIGSRAAEAWCAMQPGSGTALLRPRREGEGGRVVWAVGSLASLSAHEVGDSLLTSLQASTGRGLAPVSAAAAHAVGIPRPQLLLLASGPDRDRFLLAASTSRLSVEQRVLLESLAAQVEMAEVNCVSHSELVTLAHHDTLTGLPNRGSFFEGLRQAIEAVEEHEDSLGLLVIDLDDFKIVNDTLGHAAGDEVLITVAQRLAEAVAGVGMACRFGGDEFAVFVVGVQGLSDVLRFADRLLEALMEPTDWNGERLQAGASIGVAAAAPGTTAADLLHAADIAMYAAKARGKHRVVPYTEDEHGFIAALRQLE